MGMNVGSSSGSDEPEVMMDVNTTPLIDVMLVLLVMLIITIPIQLHSVNLEMPPPNKQTPPKEPTVVELFIDFDGTVSWNAVPVANHAELEVRLAEIAKLSKEDQPEIHIKPNKLVDYGAVAQVMAAVQRDGILEMLANLGTHGFLCLGLTDKAETAIRRIAQHEGSGTNSGERDVLDFHEVNLLQVKTRRPASGGRVSSVRERHCVLGQRNCSEPTMAIFLTP